MCFNPCFNGRCKRTGQQGRAEKLIERCFNPCFNGRCKRTMTSEADTESRIFVSILVLMEDVKEHFPFNNNLWIFV